MVLKVKKRVLHRIDALNYQDLSRSSIISNGMNAGIAQLVEHNLAKVGVASSSLVSRSKIWVFSRQYGEIQYVS